MDRLHALEPMSHYRSEALRVVAGILSDGDGRVLLAQRKAGSHLAGMWEFPGGKLEPGEAAETALRRELHEELGIRLVHCRALITVPWEYPEYRIALLAFTVSEWHGRPQSCEGQALRWQHPHAIRTDELAPADRPVLALLQSSADERPGRRAGRAQRADG
ncbi:MAG: 8-oxo-dGTP diphosphatase MutT [Rhodanobacteraceae bacterium]